MPGVPILDGSRPMDRKDHSVSDASSNFGSVLSQMVEGSLVDHGSVHED